MLFTSGISAGFLTPFYLLYVYVPHLIQHQHLLSISNILLMNVFALGFTAMALLWMGWLGDKVGARNVMAVCAFVFALIAYPLFSLLNHAQTMWEILLLELIMSVLIAGVSASSSVILSYWYPPQRRYSGMAFAWGIWAIIFGGLTPMIAQGLVILTGNENAPAFWLIFSSVGMILCLKYAPCVAPIEKSIFQFFSINDKKLEHS